MKKLFLTLFLLFCLLFGYANTIYEIKYKFDDETAYTAFLVRYDNQTGFIRVKYYNAKKQYRVVHMDFVEEYSKREAEGVWYDALRFVGKNPSFVLGNSDQTESYNPDYIWFYRLAKQQDYKPWAVTSPGADGKTSQGTILSFRLLNTNELTESYVNSFFGSTEPFFINLFKKNNPKPIPGNSASTSTANTNVTGAGSIKLIMVANTTDPIIGLPCLQDLERVKKTFKDIAVTLGMGFNVTEIKGEAFGKQNMMNAVNNLSSTINDVVVFCYSGHGFHFEHDLQNPYPQFDLRISPKQDVNANTVNVTEIYTTLKTQKAHLKLILTDCCNAFLESNKQFGKAYPSTPRSVMQWSKSNCESLFKRQSGVVVASAASVGEIARCNTTYGGFFLFNFLKSLDKSLSVFGNGQSWENIIAETKATVLSMSMESDCEAKVCTQTAISYITTK